MTTTPLPVRADDRRAWQDALARDHSASRWIQPRSVDRRDDSIYARYSVESLSNPHAPHTVTVVAVDDRTTVTCTCKRFALGGTDGCHICTHAAIVLEHLAAWPFVLLAPDETVYVTLASTPPPEVWRCPRCDAPYESYGQLKQHQMLAHDNPPNPNRRVVERPTAAAGAALLGRAGGGR